MAEHLREEASRLVKLLFDRRLLLADGGNLSLRVDDSTCIISPSGSGYRQLWDLANEDFLEIGFDDEVCEELHPSMEYPLHLSIYSNLAEIGAVIHAHSPAIMSFAVLGAGLSPITHQSKALLGEVPCLTYSRELALAFIRSRRSELEFHGLAWLIEGHGVVAVGKDGNEAAAILDALDSLAKLTLDLKIHKIFEKGKRKDINKKNE